MVGLDRADEHFDRDIGIDPIPAFDGRDMFPVQFTLTAYSVFQFPVSLTLGYPVSESEGAGPYGNEPQAGDEVICPGFERHKAPIPYDQGSGQRKTPSRLRAGGEGWG
ncbi:MAG TPA: hypothetical protein DCL54_05020 [Alphaproteobacteria bacterium]|nr:hypothetical protein [Alphaproteobacteria bacterium]